MESRRDWQDCRESAMRGVSVARETKISQSGEQRGEEGGEGMLTYGGRQMSMEVYLAVPTYLRRGITITA